MVFDPDKFLAEPAFDPDAFLGIEPTDIVKTEPVFDPDTFGIEAPQFQPEVSTTTAVEQPLPVEPTAQTPEELFQGAGEPFGDIEQPPRIQPGKAFVEGVKQTAKAFGGIFKGIGETRKELQKKNIKILKGEVENTTGERQQQAKDLLQQHEEEKTVTDRTIEVGEKILKAKILKPDETFKKLPGVAGYIQDVIMTAPQIVGTVGATVVGGPVAGFTFTGGIIAGSKYEQLREEGVDPIRAATASIADAAGQSLLEQIGIGKALKTFKPNKAAKKALREIVEAGGVEFFTEVMQKYPEAITEIWAQGKGKTLGEQTSEFISKWWDITKEGFREGFIALPFGGGISAVGVAARPKAKPDIEAPPSIEQKAPVEAPKVEPTPEVVEPVTPPKKVESKEVKPLTEEEKFVKKVRPEVTIEKKAVKKEILPEVKKPERPKPVVKQKVKKPPEIGAQEQIEKIKEKQLKERSFPITAEKKGLPSATDRWYKPQTHAETKILADNIIKEKGTEGSIKWLRDTEMPSAEHTEVAYQITSKLQQQSEDVKAKSPVQSEALMERAIKLTNEMSERLTRIGQEVESVKMRANLSPDAVVFARQRTLNRFNKDRPDKNKVVLKTPEAESLRKLAKTAENWETIAVSSEKANDVLGQVLAKKELNKEDISFLRDYKQNIDRVLGESTEKIRPKTKPKKTLDVISASLERRAQEALARFDKRNTKSVTLHAGIPFDDMIDLSAYGAFKVAKTGVDFVKWSGEMIGQFGKPIEPHLKKIWDRSMDIFRAEGGRVRRLQKEKKVLDSLMQKIDRGELNEPANIKLYKDAIKSIQKLTGDAKTEAILELQSSIENVPEASLGRKIATIQTIAQLLNIKTVGRNIIGNEMFWRIERLNKYVATPVDILTSIKTGKRTVTYKARDAKGYWEGFFRGRRAALKGYSPGSLETQYGLKGQTFRGKNPLTYLEKRLGVVLRGTDFAAYNRAKNFAFAEEGEIQAINNAYHPKHNPNGIKLKDRKKFVQDFVKNPDALSAKMAHEYGKYVTFQDSNFLSKNAVALKKLLNKVGISKGDFGLGDLILKYPYTPANLLNRGLAYSPAGFAKSMYHIARAFRGHEFNQKAFVESFSRAIIGFSGFTGMGYMLYMQGIMTGSPEDWKIRDFKRQETGEGPYKVNVSALKRWVMSAFSEKIKIQRGDFLLSYDWAQPLAISLALGANIAKGVQESVSAKKYINITYGSIIDALEGGVQTVAEQPLLTGLQTLIGSGGYGMEEGERWMKSLERVLVGAPSSFGPTLVNQVRQSTDNTARETYDPNPFKQALNSVINKLPWFEKNLPASYKTLGIKEKEIYQDNNGNPILNLFNIFINPAFVSKYKTDPLIEAILDPYRDEARKRQFPRRPRKKFSISMKQIKEMTGKTDSYLKRRGLDTKKAKVRFELTGQEFSDMQRVMAGLTQKKFSEAVRKGKERKDGYYKRFKSLSPEEQENLLANILNDVSKDAKKYYLKRKLRTGF